MKNFISKKISFSLVVALILGWGLISLMLIQSSKEMFQAELLESGINIQQPKGVKLRLQVDKNVYGPDETVLISLRNDSRQPIWLTERADGCSDSWWQVEKLIDGDVWQAVDIHRQDCPELIYGLSAFEQHALRTAAWNGLVQTEQLGEVFDHAPTGTYRIRAPFLNGDNFSESDWLTAETKAVMSASFTIQGEIPGSASS